MFPVLGWVLSPARSLSASFTKCLARDRRILSVACEVLICRCARETGEPGGGALVPLQRE